MVNKLCGKRQLSSGQLSLTAQSKFVRECQIQSHHMPHHGPPQFLFVDDEAPKLNTGLSNTLTGLPAAALCFPQCVQVNSDQAVQAKTRHTLQ